MRRPLPLLVLVLVLGAPSWADEATDAWQDVHALLTKGDREAATQRAAKVPGVPGERLRAALTAATAKAQLDDIAARRDKAAGLLESDKRDEGRAELLRAADAAAAIGWATAVNACYRLAVDIDNELGGGAEYEERLHRWEAHAKALGDAYGQVNAVGSLMRLAAKSGAWDRASTYRARLHSLAEGATSQPLRAFLHAAEGLYHREARDYPRAIENMREAARLHRGLGELMPALRQEGNVAALLRESGHAKEALGLARGVLVQQEKIGDGSGAASTQASIGACLEYLGRPVEALAAYQEARRRAVAAGERMTEVVARLGQITLHNRMGEFKRGLEAAKSLFADTANDQNIATRIRAHLALADSHVNVSETEAAEEHLTGAEALLTAQPDAYLSIRTLAARTYLLSAQGKNEEALEIRRGLVARWTALGDPWQAAYAQNAVAYSLLELERAAEALPIATAAVRMAEALEANELLLSCIVRQAVAAFHAPNNLIALEAVERAAALIPEVYGGLTGRQGSLARVDASEALVRGAYAAASLQAIRAVWRYLETLRGMSLVEGLAARARVGTDAVPKALRTKEQTLRGLEASRVAELRVAIARGKRGPVREARTAVLEVRTELRQVREAMQRALKSAADVYFVDPIDFDKTRKTLKPDEAILYYAAWGYVRSIGMRIEAGDYKVGLVGSEDEVIEALKRAAFGDASGEPEAPLRRIHARLITPLGLGKHIKRVYIVADGALCDVPFGALLPDKEVVFVPSGTTLHLLRDDAALRGDGVLALGDPVYGEDRGAAPGAAKRKERGGISFKLTPLPNTALEAKAVGDVVLLGAEANETRLRAALKTRPRWRAVHLACHGLIDTENPMDSALALSVTEGEDGFLTGGEAQSLALRTDLVALSACETARGRKVQGDGILGLTRAFMFAGAPRVVVSLWKVDDAATSELMKAFYAKWNPKDGSAGISAAAALRAAQAHVRNQPKWKHPYYWAAWTLWGVGD